MNEPGGGRVVVVVVVVVVCVGQAAGPEAHEEQLLRLLQFV